MVKVKSKKINDKSWKTVKIDGPVISDDGNLEGLVGLEILEDYNNSFVKKEKKKKVKEVEDDDEVKAVTKKCKRKRKVKFDESCSESEDSGVDFKATKKQSQSKTNKKAKVEEISEEQSDESDSFDLSDSENESQNGNQGGKFVLLKNALTEDSTTIEKPKKKKKKRKKNKIQKGDKKAPEILADKLDTLAYQSSAWFPLGVPEEIIRSLLEQNFKTPTQIQLETIPAAIVAKRDILGAAETGSGKTLAFGIPVLNGIMEIKRRQQPIDVISANTVATKQNNPNGRDLTPPPEELEFYPPMDSDEENEMEEINEANGPIQNDDDDEEEDTGTPLYALVLTPTRELAVQIHNHLTTAAKYTGINIAAIFGGLATVKQERILKKCPEIVIATPGRLWELIQSGNSHLKKVDDIKYLVVDETDRMIEKGHFEELKKLLERLNMESENKTKRQNFIFSATLTMVHDLPDYVLAKRKGFNNKNNVQKMTSEQKIGHLIKTLGASNPKVIDITENNSGTAKLLTECRILCRMDHKDFYLYFFLQRHPGRTMVFCNSIESVKRLSSLFGYLNSQIMTLHGNMEQKQRLRNLEKFRDNPLSVMIATDVAARGLDIPNVKHVIHYQVPRTSENYVHRSGRTARANNEGIAILLIEPKEVGDYVKLNNTLGRLKDLPLFPVSDVHLKAVKERVILAREIELLDLKLRRASERVHTKKKTRKDAEMDSDADSNVDSEEEDHRKLQLGNERRKLKARKHELAYLLTQPLFPLSISDMKFPTSNGAQPSFNYVNENAITEVRNSIEQNKLLKKQLQKKKH